MTQKFYTTHPLKNAITLAFKSSVFMVFGACSNHLFAEYNTQLTLDSRESMPSVTLDPMVITATRSNKRLSESPIAIQVLDKDTLQQHHTHTLKEALTLLPNVYLTPLHDTARRVMKSECKDLQEIRY